MSRFTSRTEIVVFVPGFILLLLLLAGIILSLLFLRGGPAGTASSTGSRAGFFLLDDIG
jgi:hypothetical protein